MIFRTFSNVFISIHVILVFPKHINSKVFWCNLRRNHANRQSKASWRFVKKWKDNEWRFKRPLKTLQEGEILFQVPRQVLWKKTPKVRRNIWLRAKNTLVHSQVWSRRAKIHSCSPGCFPCALGCIKTHLCAPSSESCACSGVLFWEITAFCYFLVKKSSFKAQTQVETLPINTTSLIHYFSFRMRRFKRKASVMRFKGEISLPTLNL